MGCPAETLRGWVRQKACDSGQRPGLSSAERQRLKALECDVRELRQATKILRKAAAFLPRRRASAGLSHDDG